MKTDYVTKPPPANGLQVVFINDEGIRLVRDFESEYLARKFAEKIKRSKKCTLVSYPLFK